MTKYFHFPTPNGVNNALRIGGKGSLSAKHNYDHVAVPVGFDYEEEDDSLTKLDEVIYEDKPFTYASLFSGVGGFEQALNKLGGTCVFASEFDKFATQAYTALYGGEHLHGDVTKIDEKDVPDHDLLVGGFPCQSFSLAGKRKGFDDTRGTLFFDIARIAAEKKPKALLLENVKGLVNHDKGRTLDLMIETLNDIGYIVDFNVLNSKYFGVPQNRERIFIVAIRKDLFTNAGGDIEAEPFSDESTTGQTIVPKGKRRIGEWANVFNFDWPEQVEVTTRLRDVLEAEVDEKYYLDEERTAKLVEQLEDKTLEETDGCEMLGHVDIKGNESIKRVYSPKGVGNALTTMGGGHREPKIAEEQSFDAGLMDGHTKIREDGTVSTVTASYAKGLCGQGRPFVFEPNPRYRIRKLSPLECFRLQGFPDSAHQALVDEGISDSQRYKQSGNAVTVPVIEAIGERLIPLINA